MQAGGEPDDGQVDQGADDVVPQLSGISALGAEASHGHRGGVDDGDTAGVGGAGVKPRVL